MFNFFFLISYVHLYSTYYLLFTLFLIRFTTSITIPMLHTNTYFNWVPQNQNQINHLRVIKKKGVGGGGGFLVVFFSYIGNFAAYL